MQWWELFNEPDVSSNHGLGVLGQDFGRMLRLSCMARLVTTGHGVYKYSASPCATSRESRDPARYPCSWLFVKHSKAGLILWIFSGNMHSVDSRDFRSGCYNFAKISKWMTSHHRLMLEIHDSTKLELPGQGLLAGNEAFIPRMEIRVLATARRPWGGRFNCAFALNTRVQAFWLGPLKIKPCH